MTEGFKTHELFHKTIILEYNNKEKHNKLACLQTATGIPPILFPFHGNIQKKHSLLSSERMRNASTSGSCLGTTGDLEKPGERKPFPDFTTVNSLLYLHKFVYQFPDVLSKVLGELLEWAFKESIKKNNIKQKPFEKENRRQFDQIQRKQHSNTSIGAMTKRTRLFSIGC